MPRSSHFKPRSCRLSLLCVCLVLPHFLVAAPPVWWAQRGATNANPSDDTAVANLGQLKHFAAKARDELNANLPGGAGITANQLVRSWLQPVPEGVVRDDRIAVNLGQLKYVASAICDRLIEAGYLDYDPWTASGLPADDSALANIGQLKRVFQFDITLDTDGDGLPDWFEVRNRLDPNDQDQNDDGVIDRHWAIEDDGTTAWQVFQQQAAPPTLPGSSTGTVSILGGDNQEGGPDQVLAQPLTVKVVNEGTGLPIANATVTFEVVSGSGSLLQASGEQTYPTIAVTTNAQGVGSVRWMIPSGDRFVSRVNVSTADASGIAEFHATTRYDLPPAAPTNVAVSSLTPQSKRLQWQDNSTDEARFIIQRSEDKAKWTSIGSTLANATEFVDFNAPDAVDYFYRIVSSY